MTQAQLIHIALVLLAACAGAFFFWIATLLKGSGPVCFGVGLLVFGLVLLAVPA